jgi:hypothetical protein
MATNGYSAQHTQIWIADSLNTVQELSDFFKRITVSIDCDTIDGTTFRQNGYSIAKMSTKGSLMVRVECQAIWHKDLIKVIRQVVHSINGFYLRTAAGNNAYPQVGSEVFEMTATLLNLPITAATGKAIEFPLIFQPADGGAIFPALYKY